VRRTASGLIITGLVIAAFAIPGSSSSAPAESPHRVAAARAALARAARALGAGTNGRITEPRPDASLALLDLFRARNALHGNERRQADALLARPTDGAKDPYGDGYTVPAKVKCSTHVCLHWVTKTQDKPPGQAWVNTTLTTLNKVWSFEVGQLGYRAPLPDGNRGGSSKFDVYLADVGSKGYYGYCAAEAAKPGNPNLASGFCVLDNDFSASQFPAPPMLSLKVTAAHEFFHAVQYGYDVNEDRWLMEATATWMEERFADGANDNRQYLPHGQLGDPHTPLDKFGYAGSWQYGNWIFFEFLSQKYGPLVVRKIWGQAAAFQGAPHQWSLAAIRTVLLGKSTTLPRQYGAFAGGNTVPAAAYAEGSKYTPAPIDSTVALSTTTTSTGPNTISLDHLTSRTIELTPGDDLTDPGWKVSLTLDLPDSSRGSAAYVVVKLSDGSLQRVLLTLDGHGDATVTKPFSAATVTAVTLTLANGSSRMSCWQGKPWSCSGKPLDDDLDYAWSASLLPPA